MNANELDAKLATELPFEAKQQDALLGYVLREKTFFIQVKDRLKGNWFLDGWSGKLYDSYVKFYNRYNRTPLSDAEFLVWEDITCLPPLEREKVRAAAIRCRNESQNFGMDLLQDGLTGWLQSRVYHQYVEESARLFNTRQFDKAKAVLGVAVRELQDIHFDGQPAADFGNPMQLVANLTQECNNALTLGHPLLDKKMNPDATNGSLLRGDSTVLLSSTNTGKSTCMITIAVHNILAGHRVLFMVHEGREADLMEKIWCCLLNCTKAKFRQVALNTDEKAMQMIAAIAKMLKERLTFIHFQRPGVTVEEVVGSVRIHQQRSKAQTGKGYDLFINDYPAILTTDQAKNVRMERRTKDAIVYRYIVDLAGEEGFHAIMAAQTNREGSKMNSRSGEYRRKNSLLTLDYIQESYEITNSATNLITLNRSPEDQARNLMTLLFCKSRSSETNWAVTCQTLFAHARTHGPTMKATAFRGTEGLEQIESAIQDFNGVDVDIERYKKPEEKN
jgi:hypothetical protein